MKSSAMNTFVLNIWGFFRDISVIDFEFHMVNEYDFVYLNSFIFLKQKKKTSSLI